MLEVKFYLRLGDKDVSKSETSGKPHWVEYVDKDGQVVRTERFNQEGKLEEIDGISYDEEYNEFVNDLLSRVKTE